MKNKFAHFILLAFILSLVTTGCDGSFSTSNEPETSIETDNEAATPQKIAGLPSELLGKYHGIQPGYFMKNEYGDDMVINGNKISVPSIDYKFLLKEGNTVSLQQISLEDNSRYYYEGTLKILSDNATSVKIECALSDDGHTSKPTYILTIYKSDQKASCRGNDEPEFQLEKI